MSTARQVIGGAILLGVGIVIVVMGYDAYTYCGGVLLGVILTQWNAGDET